LTPRLGLRHTGDPVGYDRPIVPETGV